MILYVAGILILYIYSLLFEIPLKKFVGLRFWKQYIPRLYCLPVVVHLLLQLVPVVFCISGRVLLLLETSLLYHSLG